MARVNVATASYTSSSPKLVKSSNGTLALFYIVANAVYYKKSTDGEITWGSAIAAVSQSTMNTNSRFDVYLDSNDDIYLTYTYFSGSWTIGYIKLTYGSSAWTNGTQYAVKSALFGNSSNPTILTVNKRSDGLICLAACNAGSRTIIEFLTNINSSGSGAWTDIANTETTVPYGISLLAVGSDMWLVYERNAAIYYKIFTTVFGTEQTIVASGISNNAITSLWISDSNLWIGGSTSSGIKAFHYTGSWDSGTLVSDNANDSNITFGIISGSDICCMWSDYDGAQYDLSYNSYLGSWQGQFDITSDAAVDILPTIAGNTTSSLVKYAYLSDTTIYFDSGVKQTHTTTITSNAKIILQPQHSILSNAKIWETKFFFGQLQARVTTEKDFNVQLQVAYPAPVNPTSLIATDPKLGDALFLTWTGSSDNAGYNVYKDIGGSWIKQNQTLIYDYQTTIGELVSGLTYSFKVVGVNGEGIESTGTLTLGTPTFDIQYRTNPAYEISIGGIISTGYILDSIELVYGPSFCTASFHKNIRPTDELLLATGQTVYIKINGRYVFGGYLFKREEIWSGGALQVNFTVTGFAYYYSTFCRQQTWPPAKKNYISKFDEDSLVGNTELEARAAIAAYHGTVLYSSPITGGLSEYRYGFPVSRRTYTIGQNILEENLINDKTNQIKSVTAVSDFSQYTEIKQLQIIDSNKEGNLFKTTDPDKQEQIFPFTLHDEMPTPKNTAFSTLLTPFKTKDDVKGFYFKLNLGGFESEISNVKVQARTNSAPKVTKLLQIMEEVPALSDYGTDYGFTKWVTTGNVEFTPMDILEKRYSRMDPALEELVAVAHPWRDGSFSSKPAIVSFETYPLEWQDASASVDYSYDETGKTAYIVLNSVPVRYQAAIIYGTLEREIFDPVTAELRTEELTVAYEEDPDQYIAEMRILYTYKGKRYSYTVGSGLPNRYIVQGITPIFNEEDEEYGLPGDNLDEVMDTLIDAANTEFHKSDLPVREGSLQILGDETLDLRTTVNGLDVVRVHHSFNDGFRTSLELSIPQSEYASTLHILNKDKERKRENESLKPAVSTLEYNVNKIKDLFGKSAQVAETSVKPDSSLSTYA
jgi:hypothetical protein